MQFQRLTVLASAVVIGLGLSSGAYAFSAEMTKSYSQGEKASYLAGAHNQKAKRHFLPNVPHLGQDQRFGNGDQQAVRDVPRAQRIG